MKIRKNMQTQKLIIYSLLFIVSLAVTIKIMAQGTNDAEIAAVSTKLNVDVLQDKVRFTLIVTNNADTRAVLQFPTSQHYDFLVETRDGRHVWLWSGGKMFTQSLTAFTLDPKEENKFTEEHSLPAGEYRAMGILPTTPNKVFTEWKLFKVSKSKISQERPVLKGKVAKILDKLYLLGEDGTAYLVEDPPKELFSLEGKTIRVKSYKAEPVPNTVDKKLIIEGYSE